MEGEKEKGSCTPDHERERGVAKVSQRCRFSQSGFAFKIFIQIVENQQVSNHISLLFQQKKIILNLLVRKSISSFSIGFLDGSTRDLPAQAQSKHSFPCLTCPIKVHRLCNRFYSIYVPCGVGMI